MQRMSARSQHKERSSFLFSSDSHFLQDKQPLLMTVTMLSHFILCTEGKDHFKDEVESCGHLLAVGTEKSQQACPLSRLTKHSKCSCGQGLTAN